MLAVAFTSAGPVIITVEHVIESNYANLLVGWSLKITFWEKLYFCDSSVIKKAMDEGYEDY